MNKKFLKLVYCPEEDKKLHRYLQRNLVLGKAIRFIKFDHGYKDDDEQQSEIDRLRETISKLEERIGSIEELNSFMA